MIVVIHVMSFNIIFFQGYNFRFEITTRKRVFLSEILSIVLGRDKVLSNDL